MRGENPKLYDLILKKMRLVDDITNKIGYGRVKLFFGT